MSDVVKLAARLPGDPEVNGLDAITGDLIARPQTMRCAVIWYDTIRVTENIELGVKIPTVQVLRVEPISDASEMPAELADLVQAAAQKRLGHEPLPFDEVDPDGVEVYATGPGNDDARERVR